MHPPHVLVVEDDANQRDLLHAQLSVAGYQVSFAATAAEALSALTQNPPQLITLDLRLPDMPGEELCARIRTQSRVPIVVASVYGHEELKARLLDAGADDFVVKPIPYAEFLARLRAALRRADTWSPPGNTPPAPPATRLSYGRLVIDIERRQVLQGDAEVHLRPIEWAVLRLLLEAPGEVVTQARIMEAVWGQVDEGRRASLHVAINGLRRRLEDAGSQSLLIVTVPGVGYRAQAVPDKVRAAQSELPRR